MLRTLYRTSDGGLRRDLDTEGILAAVADPGGTLWVDILVTPEETPAIAELLGRKLGFHPLAVDDALNESHVPRVDDWRRYLFIVLHGLDFQASHEVRTKELDVFLGPNFVVTLHEEPFRSIERTFDTCTLGPDRWMGAGPDHVLYALADRLVGSMVPVVDGIDDEIDTIEAEAFKIPRKGAVNRIFVLRRALLSLRRILGTQREVLNRLARDSYSVIDDADRLYFRDVYDHAARLYDHVDTLREMAQGALDRYLTVASNRTGEVMRTLTVITALFLPISFLSSFFGMNFFGDNFALKTNPLGREVIFWTCVSLMALAPPTMLVWMARKGWLRGGVLETGGDSLDLASLFSRSKEAAAEVLPLERPPWAHDA
jgi:magnesium transporter